MSFFSRGFSTGSLGAQGRNKNGKPSLLPDARLSVLLLIIQSGNNKGFYYPLIFLKKFFASFVSSPSRIGNGRANLAGKFDVSWEDRTYG